METQTDSDGTKKAAQMVAAAVKAAHTLKAAIESEVTSKPTTALAARMDGIGNRMAILQAELQRVRARSNRQRKAYRSLQQAYERRERHIWWMRTKIRSLEQQLHQQMTRGL